MGEELKSFDFEKYDFDQNEDNFEIIQKANKIVDLATKANRHRDNNALSIATQTALEKKQQIRLEELKEQKKESEKIEKDESFNDEDNEDYEEDQLNKFNYSERRKNSNNFGKFEKEEVNKN